MQFLNCWDLGKLVLGIVDYNIFDLAGTVIIKKDVFF